MDPEQIPQASAARLLPDLSDSEREKLQEAVSELFHHQAILRDLPGDRDLFDWARIHYAWIREACALIGFEVILNEDEQLLYALPGERVTLKRLRVEQTLVLLALWHDYDVKLRAEGSPVIFTVENFNESLQDKLGDRKPAVTSLRESLSLFASRKLLQMHYDEPFHHSRIEVLPTIRFVLPFGELEKVSLALEELLHAGDNSGEEVRDG